MPLATCPTREELSSYVLGKLPDDTSSEFDEHLVDCTKCQTALETLAVPADSLLADLQRPACQQEYFAESECHEAVALVQAIGRDPSFAASPAANIEKADSADLGQIHVYKLLAKLGEGGMGAVYKALHTHLNKVVALKLLPKDQTADQHAVARFKREMLAVGALEHPNIVRATDAGEHEGVHFLVMEYVKGQDLSKIAKQHGPLPVAAACELVRQAAVGLQHAHEHGLIHRDIKPSNLMLAVSGQQSAVSHDNSAIGVPALAGHPKSAIVKILDLGLALLQEHQADNARDLTGTGQMMGTLDYMAPEQGDDSHEVDIRADIYALGATLYKLLCGEAPFGGPQYNTPVKKLMALASEEPQSITARRDDLPDGLAEVVHKMLAKNPTARYVRPAEVAAALAPFATNANLAALVGWASPTESEQKCDTAPSISASTPTPATVPRPQGRSGLDRTKIHTTQPLESPVRRRTDLQSWSFDGRFRIAAISAAVGGIILLGVVTLLLRTKDGTIVVKIDDPEGLIQVTIVGEDIVITEKDQSGESIKLRPGVHKLHVQRGDLKFATDSFTLDRGKQVVMEVRLIDASVQVVQDEKVVKTEPLSDFALEFDGKSSYVEIPNLTFEGCAALTFEGYFLPDASHFTTVPVSEKSSTNNYMCFESNCFEVQINASADGYRFTWGGALGDQGGNLQTSPFKNLSKRFHVAVCWDGHEARLYVDGRKLLAKKIGNGQTFVDSNSLAKLTSFGRRSPRLGRGTPPFQLPFRGQMDEIRLSTIARYDSGFIPAMRFTQDEHTLALYHFDDGPGSKIARDSSGNKHHGTIYGAKWVSAKEESFNGSSSVSEIQSDTTSAAETESTEILESRAAIDGATTKVESVVGLVGYWAFDEGEGMTVSDSSGNGHHGTLKNMDATAWVTAESGELAPVSGNRAALKFDGDDDVVTVPYNAAFDLDGPFTLSAWIRRPAEPEINRYERIIDHHFVNGYAFVIMNMKGLKGQTAMHIAGGNAIAYNSHGPSVMDGKWHHVAAVCDGSELRIYQDGRPLVKGRIKRGKPTTKAPLAFGNNASSLPGEEGFHGLLDDIRIYDRALSDAEIKAIAIGDS